MSEKIGAKYWIILKRILKNSIFAAFQLKNPQYFFLYLVICQLLLLLIQLA